VREIQYSRRLETEVRERTDEIAQRNNELSVLNDKLMEASLTDPLTGLRNRRFVFEQVAKDVDLVQRQHFDTLHGVEKNEVVDLVLMMVDLDHFKPVNDEYGHAAGDEMLLQVRDVLLSACRSSDFVVRWGGDEFLVIARHTNAQEAEVLAERIRSRLAQKIFPLGDGNVGRTSASIGFVCYPLLSQQPDVVPWDEVLNLADTAMYRAKERRNAWVGYIGPGAAPSATVMKNALRTSPEALAEDGILQVRESKPQSAISQTA
jgi:diguanylate cyclase (GGDEF)-like protein